MNIIKQNHNRIVLLKEIYNKIQPRRACEVGVQQGIYSKEILMHMPSLEKLYLIDIWEQLTNYVDNANVDNKHQQKYYKQTLSNTQEWAEKIAILRGYSTVMCDEIPDSSLDWVYIDTRHDYKGVSEDIKKYWPKVRDGGIISGHDYLTSGQVKKMTPRQNWSICYDGSIEPRAVKGAVDDFASSVKRDVFVTNDKWPSWSIFK